MVFKHGLIPLEAHSWLTANLAVTFCRQEGLDDEVQRLSWVYGLTHDAGVLSLQAGFDHSHVGESEVNLLLRLVKQRYNVEVMPEQGKDIIEFAHLHAKSHGRKALRDELKNRFGEEVVENVSKADQVSTGREKFGFQREDVQVLRSYTTPFKFHSPYRRHNLVCFQEHSLRMGHFKTSLERLSGRVSDELGIPKYDPIVALSTWSVEYHLSDPDKRELDEEHKDFIQGRSADNQITINTKRGQVTIRANRSNPTINHRCLLCGSPGKLYKGIRDTAEVRERKKELRAQGVTGPESVIHIGSGDVGRILGFEIDTWRGNVSGGRVPFQDHQIGLCGDCASALTNHQPTSEGLLLYIPSPDDVSELYLESGRKERLENWKEWLREGLCAPDPRFLEILYWVKTPEYSESLRGLDERRARYERTLEIYHNGVEALGAVDHGVYGSAEPSEEALRGLVDGGRALPPVSYGCLKDVGVGRVAINGFSFNRVAGGVVMRLILAGVRFDPSLGVAENLLQAAGKVKDLSRRELDLVVDSYDQIMGALSM